MSPDLHADSVRATVRAELKSMLPEGWDIKPGLSMPTTLSQPTMYLEYGRIEPLPEAPIGHVRCTFELTLTASLSDLTKGEDWADDAVIDLVLALDAHPTIAWAPAEKVVVKETYLAWKIPVSVIASTTPTPTPTPDPEPDPEPDSPEE